jgi:hypothetical protein
MGTVARFYSNNAVQNTLGGTGVTISATSMYLASTPSGYPGQFPFTLWLEPGTANQEAVSVTSGAGTVGVPWVITRAFDGTLARAHSAGVVVAHELSAFDVSTSRLHESLDSTTALPHALPLSAWAGAAFGVIQETVMPDSTGTVVNFPSIPQTYSHLLLVIQGRNTNSTSRNAEAVCNINGNTAARYSYIDNRVLCTPTLIQPGATSGFAQSSWNPFINMPGSLVGSAVNAGGGFALFPNYAGTTFNKFALALSGWGTGTDANATGFLRWCFFNPSTQTAITSLAIAASQSTFQSGTFMGLYGVG